MADGMIRVAENDPTRCQGIRAGNQCQLKAVDGSKFCRMCGGVNVEKRALYDFRSMIVKSRVSELSSSSDLKTLVTEIGILRLLIEQKLNSCQTETDLMIHSAAISDLVMKLEKLITSWTKIEASLGAMINKQELAEYMSALVDILGAICTEEQLTEIATKLSALPTPGSK